VEKLIFINEEGFNQLNEKLDKLICKSISEDVNKMMWLTNNAVMDLLAISKSTLQTYRDQQIIPFYQIGRKILYKPADVDKLMEKFRVPSIL